jgi:hypothetical protein
MKASWGARLRKSGNQKMESNVAVYGGGPIWLQPPELARGKNFGGGPKKPLRLRTNGVRFL